MMSAAGIRAHVVEQIQHIYLRPRMHGLSAIEVDGLIWHFQALIAFIDEVADFREEHRACLRSASVPSGLHFSTHVQNAFPNESEDELIARVVKFWQEFDIARQTNQK
jgi:hypothetical protein